MKNLFLASLIGLTLVSCGDKVYNREGITNTVEVEKVSEYTGTWYNYDGGEYEIVADDLGRFDINNKDYLISVNPDNDTFATHPRVSRNDEYPMLDGSIRFSLNVNYSSSAGDVEQDAGGDIDGKRRTDYVFKLNEDATVLTVTINIYSASINNNSNYIVATRNFELVK